MTVGLIVWLGLAGVIGLVWLSRVFTIGKSLRSREILCPRPIADSQSPDTGQDSAVYPKVSVLIAARDEEDTIETCVRTMLDQDYPHFEIVVVDDRSMDRTPELLRNLEPESGGRLRVIRVCEVPNGWFGKNNAMRIAVEASTGAWLLFTDADCRQTSLSTISTAMHFALHAGAGVGVQAGDPASRGLKAETPGCREKANGPSEGGVDLLSITPILETRSVWERILQPACAIVLMVRFRPEFVNDPRRKVAYANGAFMLFRRTCYDAIGGHSAVRNFLNEDIALARRVKESGFRLRVVGNAGLYSTRMYPTLRRAWSGWSRIFRGCLESPFRLAVSALLVLIFSVLPWIGFVSSLGGWWWGASEEGAFRKVVSSVWGGVVLLQQTAMWRLYPALSVGCAWSLLYVLGAIATLGVLVRAWLQAIGFSDTVWRGRAYRGVGPRVLARPEEG